MKVQYSAVILAVAMSSQTASAFTIPKPTIRSTINLHATSTESTSSTTTPTSVDCIVVGGGISGSTLAHNINSQSNGKTSVLLTEARDYIGGNVKSHRTPDGFLWEEGPNSFATQPSIVRISHELGIDDQLVFANESLPPWVNHNGKLHPLPKGLGGKGPKGQLELVFGRNGVLKFGLTGELLSWPGKIRAGIGALIGHLPPPTDKEENIREWVTRILGEEVFLRCIDPFVSGVYAGNPETLSMKAALSKINRIENYAYDIEWNKFGAIFYGGLARQVELTKERKADPPNPEWVEFEYGNPGSFKEGLSTLPNAIAKNLGDKVKTEWKLLTIEDAPANENGYKYVATYETPEGIQSIQTKAIVSTIPTHALQGTVLENIMPGAKDVFNTIRSNVLRKGVYHPPVAAVTVAYPKSSFKDVELPNGFGNLQNLPGFGSLNPRTEGVRTLGTLWSSSLFPGRCPEDYNLLLNYIGGSRDVGLAELTNEEIIGEVDKGCRQVLLKPDAPEPKVIGMKVWPTAIPQYELGHLELMEKLEELEQEKDGLWICGNYRTGVAFPDCVTFGYEHAKTVIDYLKNEDGSVEEKEVVVAAPVAEVEEEKNEEEEDVAAPVAEVEEKDEEVVEVEEKEEETVAAPVAEVEEKEEETVAAPVAEVEEKEEETVAAPVAEVEEKEEEPMAEVEEKVEEVVAAPVIEAKDDEAIAEKSRLAELTQRSILETRFKIEAAEKARASLANGAEEVEKAEEANDVQEEVVMAPVEELTAELKQRSILARRLQMEAAQREKVIA